MPVVHVDRGQRSLITLRDELISMVLIDRKVMYADGVQDLGVDVRDKIGTLEEGVLVMLWLRGPLCNVTATWLLRSILRVLVLFFMPY